MVIYFARHGETTGDVEDRYGGDYDDHLTEHGRSEAKELAEKLALFNIEKLFSSPRIRARETAEIVGEKLNLSTEIMDDLRERNAYGVLTGLTKSEARERFPREAEDVKNYKNTISGAESYKDLSARIKSALEKIAIENNGTVVVVSHGGPIRAIFREILKQGDIEIGNCAFAALEFDGDDWQLVKSDGIIYTE